MRRTLRKWTSLLDKGDWDLIDKSKRPKTIHYKITDDHSRFSKAKQKTSYIKAKDSKEI